MDKYELARSFCECSLFNIIRNEMSVEQQGLTMGAHRLHFASKTWCAMTIIRSFKTTAQY